MPSESLVSVNDVRVRYGERLALDGVSFAVGAGEVVGLLGPNGAGKTTTLSVLATLRAPSAGTAAVAGHVVDRLRVRDFAEIHTLQHPSILPAETSQWLWS